jgi:hypothetical protein
MPKFEKGNKMASKEVKQAAEEKRQVTVRPVGRPRKDSLPPVTVAPPETPVEPVAPPSILFEQAPTPAPAEPVPEPTPVLVKTWRCNNANCGLMWASEKELADHMWNAHRKQYRGGGKIMEGASVAPAQPITLPGGFMADARDITNQVDVYQQLRVILDSFQVRDIREAIVDSFASEDNPGDIRRLRALLVGFGIQPSRVNLIVDRWARYMENIGEAVDDVEQEQKQKERKGNPLKANLDDMADWGPGEWMNFRLEMQKRQMAMNMMTKMMDGMGMSSMDASAMGVNAPGNQAQIPRDVQMRLDRLAQYEERDKLKEALDPVMRQLTNLRADVEDTRLKNEQAPKKDSMAELMEMVKMQTLLANIGPGKGKDADVLRVQMEERIENKKMQMEKEYRELQAKLEAEKAANHTLEMRNIQVAMDAKIDNLKTLNEIATRDKGQDLESVINNALRMKETLAKFTGTADTETDDDKKMKNIMGAIQGTVETLSPAIDKMASGFLISQQRNAQPAARGPPPPGPPQARSMPTGMAPPPRNPTKSLARCTAEGCGREFEVDPSMPTAQCPGCYTVYDIGTGPKGPQEGHPSSSHSSAPVGDMGAKKDTLLRMDRASLEEVARGEGIDPEQYPTHEMLVDAMMGNAYQ